MNDPFDLPPDVLKRVPLFAELQKVLSWTDGPVNWDLARQVAISIAAGETPAAAIGGDDHAELDGYVRTAELWLEEEAQLPAPGHVVAVRAATPADWAEHAVGAYRELIDPIAAKAGKVLSEHQPGEGIESMMAGAIGQIAPMFMGIQTGTTLGMVAREVTGAADVSLPAAEGDILIVVPAVDIVAREYTLDRRAALQWIALREAARRMLLDGFGAMRAVFFARYIDYVASLDIDIARGLARLQELDMSDPQRLQEALADEGLFAPEASAETAGAAARIDAILSLLDALTAAAVDAAAARAGGMSQVGEAFRRRALSDAKGISMLHRFIGLDPANAGSARGFVRAALDRGGWRLALRALDAPESFPSPEELREPNTWIGRIEE